MFKILIIPKTSNDNIKRPVNFYRHIVLVTSNILSQPRYTELTRLWVNFFQSSIVPVCCNAINCTEILLAV